MAKCLRPGLCLLLLLCGCAEGAVDKSSKPAANAAPLRAGSVQMAANTARPGEVAIREEFDAAIKAGTREALELFIARHPASPWTEDAKHRLKQITKP